MKIGRTPKLRCSVRTHHQRLQHPERWFSGGIHAEECQAPARDFEISLAGTLQKALAQYPLIAMDPEVVCGTPRIAGTRIPVYMVLDAVHFYGTIEGALKSYPQLSPEQVKEALLFAAAVLEQPIEHELEAIVG